MVASRNIIEHHLHKGITKAEITNLLGEPPEKANHVEIVNGIANDPLRYHPVPVPQADTAVIYYLGQDLGMMQRVGRAWLHLYFDGRNRYVGWSIWQP